MPTLLRRVLRLEVERGASMVVPCPERGVVPGDPVKMSVTCGEVAGPDQCAVCGRRLVYRLEFDTRD